MDDDGDGYNDDLSTPCSAFIAVDAGAATASAAAAAAVAGTTTSLS